MQTCNVLLLEPRRLHADVLRRGLATSQPGADIETHDDAKQMLADLADRAETGAITPDLLVISCDRTDKAAATRSIRSIDRLADMMVVHVDEEPPPGEGYQSGADLVLSKPLGPPTLWRLGRTLGYILDCPPATPWPSLESAWEAHADFE